MDKKWYWIELIGFDRTQPDLGVGEFLSRIPEGRWGVSLLLYSADFVNMHDGLDTEETLSPGVCSYAGHPFNEERARQVWTNWELKKLIDLLHEKGLRVLLSVFDLFYYYDTPEAQHEATEFIKSHPEIESQICCPPRKGGFVNIMRHFADGTPYRDFYIAQLIRTLTDYGFDGVHLADGFSSQRLPLQMGDFCDDIVNQFLAATNAALPDDLNVPCDADPDKSDARFRYIMSKLRFEYTRFFAGWYADFFKKLGTALKAADKCAVFNNAWTNGPFEALFRYGIDYTAFRDSGLDGMMMEDEGSFMPLMASSDLGGFNVPVSERQYKNHTYFLRQLALKLALPQLPIYNMTTLKDNQEGWNMIDAAPYEVQKMIMRRRNSWVAQKQGFRHASDGCFYCLSDGMGKDIWDKIGRWDAMAELPEIIGTAGLTAVWCAETQYEELERFILNRRPAAEQLYDEFITAGMPIMSMIDANDVSWSSAPLIAANVELYPKKLLSALEVYQAPLFVLGYSCVLVRKADCIISEGDDGLKMFCYNCPELAGFSMDVTTEKRPVSTDFEDAHGGGWTAALRYDRPGAGFLRICRKTIERMSEFPCITNGVDCRLNLYALANGKYALLICNDSYASEQVQIRLPWKIVSAKSMNKPEWYTLKFSNELLNVRVNNRAMETVILEAEVK